MQGINLTKTLGRLGADPYLTVFKDGNKSTRLSIATNSSWKCKRTGEKKTDTQWHTIHLKGRTAEVAYQYLKKGDLVLIQGELRSRKYTDNNGVEQKVVEILGRKMLMLQRAAQNEQVKTKPLDDTRTKVVDTCDDVPFIVPEIIVDEEQKSGAAIDDDNVANLDANSAPQEDSPKASTTDNQPAQSNAVDNTEYDEPLLLSPKDAATYAADLEPLIEHKDLADSVVKGKGSHKSLEANGQTEPDLTVNQPINEEAIDAKETVTQLLSSVGEDDINHFKDTQEHDDAEQIVTATCNDADTDFEGIEESFNQKIKQAEYEDELLGTPTDLPDWLMP